MLFNHPILSVNIVILIDIHTYNILSVIMLSTGMPRPL